MRRARPAWLWIGLLALVAGAVGAKAAVEEEKLAPEDFAVGRTLEIERAGPLQSALLDFDVYRRSVEPDLADLRVFDAQGQALPYAIRRRLPIEQAADLHRSLPLFRLERPAGTAARGELGFRAEDYRIDAELSATGAIVSVRRDPGTVEAKAVPAGWLLDASALKRAIVGLEFALAAGGEDFVSALRVEASDDLARFRSVGGSLALARLEQAGHRIERTSFEIPATRGRYLRITPIGTLPATDILAVRAKLAPIRPLPKRVRARIQGRMDPEQPGIVHFDLGGLPPIEQVHVLLEEPNSLVQARLESAASPDGPWSQRFSGLLYFFEEGGGLRNPAIVWSARRDRHLRLSVSSRGGGYLGAAPSIEISWRPEQLLFVHRDDGPAQLVVGRVGTPDGSFAANELMRIAKTQPGELPESSVRLGVERVLAGEAAVTPRVPFPWRTAALWALLLVCVGIVLGLSIRLLRQVES